LSAGAIRAIAFIDGANLYSALKAHGVWANRTDPYRVAKKLVEFRELLEVRYYIAAVKRTAPARVYLAYRRLLAVLGQHKEVRICTGHIQELRESNPCAQELASYLARLSVRIPREAFRDLVDLASRHRKVTVHREKGVDVYLACDLVDLARRDAYDVAYLLSGDADFCPAVKIAQSMGKRVFAASPNIAGRLIDACDAAIRLEASWFEDCSR
jgi:uncharacterized LabA/DUF88 family protein